MFKQLFIIGFFFVVMSPLPSYATNKTASFAIYLVMNEATSLSQMQLSKQPFISDSDIVKYNWQSHEITLSEQGIIKLTTLKENRGEGKRFVVIADGIRCYHGAFWQGIWSLSYPSPVILIDSLSRDTIKIDRAYPTDAFAKGEDHRNNKRIYNALKKIGKLEEPDK